VELAPDAQEPSNGISEYSKPRGKAQPTTFGWIWLAVIALVYLAVWPVGWFDNATELTPDHSDILGYCFGAAAILAIVSGIVIFVQSEGAKAARIALALVTALASGIGGALLSSTIANIIENHIDFPAGKTRTFRALLPIGRAYRMDSRTGSSWIIQPVIWTNIDITQSDYRFMLSHRGWNGRGPEPDSVSSRAYFCARVLIQQSGDALRVLNAGRSTLPDGAVGICSEMASKDSSLTLVT
jgi:hypothetical protein